MQAAPYAVDKLEELMEYAESEPVMLKAATEILDRAGVRGGVEIDTNVNIDVRPAADVINERLNRLAQGAIHAAARLSQDGADVVDAEVVVEDQTAAAETSNEPLEVLPPVDGDEGETTSNEPLEDVTDQNSRDHTKNEERPATTNEES
jgi:hypothetical protein